MHTDIIHHTDVILTDAIWKAHATILDGFLHTGATKE